MNRVCRGHLWPAALLAAACPLFADITIQEAGYTAPTPLHVAPGQIVTIYASTSTLDLGTPVSAVTIPLPTKLAGVSVWLTAGLVAGGSPRALPLFRVAPVADFNCPSGLTCARPVAITLQIPYDIPVNQPGSFAPPVWGFLYVTESSVAQPAVSVYPDPDRIHVFTCLPDNTGAPGGRPLPVIAHADGSMVSYSEPARAGEMVTLYAAGLGITAPGAVTGEAAKGPLAVREAPSLTYEFRPNAPPYPNPALDSAIGSITPAYAGLSPGSVGLYQVNFTIPQPPPGTSACGGSLQSNMTVTITGVTSSDGGGICVAVAP